MGTWTLVSTFDVRILPLDYQDTWLLLHNPMLQVEFESNSFRGGGLCVCVRGRGVCARGVGGGSPLESFLVKFSVLLRLSVTKKVEFKEPGLTYLLCSWRPQVVPDSAILIQRYENKAHRGLSTAETFQWSEIYGFVWQDLRLFLYRWWIYCKNCIWYKKDLIKASTNESEISC